MDPASVRLPPSPPHCCHTRLLLDMGIGYRLGPCRCHPVGWLEPTAPKICQCKVLSVPFSCVGSGDPVEGLTSVHNEYTGIHFEAFIAEAYVQLATTDSTVLCSSLML